MEILAAVLEIFGITIAIVDIFFTNLRKRIEMLFERLDTLVNLFFKEVSSLIVISLYVLVFFSPVIALLILLINQDKGTGFINVSLVLNPVGIIVFSFLLTIIFSIFTFVTERISKFFNVMGGGHVLAGIGLILALLGVLVKSWLEASQTYFLILLVYILLIICGLKIECDTKDEEN